MKDNNNNIVEQNIVWYWEDESLSVCFLYEMQDKGIPINIWNKKQYQTEE